MKQKKTNKNMRSVASGALQVAAFSSNHQEIAVESKYRLLRFCDCTENIRIVILLVRLPCYF